MLLPLSNYLLENNSPTVDMRTVQGVVSCFSIYGRARIDGGSK